MIIELSRSEVEYIWLLTALDAMRIHMIESDKEKDFHYQVRHALREKLFEFEEIASRESDE